MRSLCGRPLNMKTRPFIIPIFIPQEGCRHRCAYCDQPTISGASQASWSPSSIRKHVGSYLDNCGRYPVQVAFYGGSFTLLPEARQRLFLESVQEFLKQGLVHSLRLSTRPPRCSTTFPQHPQLPPRQQVGIGPKRLTKSR